MAGQPPTCCCCVPLRPGLLAWAYIKLVLALTSIGVCVYLMMYDLRHFVNRVDYISRYRSPVVYILEALWPLAVGLLLLVFAIIFIIGVHRQSYKMLLVFLVYSLFEVMLAGAAVGWQVFDFVRNLSSYRRNYDPETYDMILQQQIQEPVLYLRLILPIVFNMLLPMYFIVLIKSEVQRLKTVYKTPARREALFPVDELERLRQQLGVKNV